MDVLTVNWQKSTLVQDRCDTGTSGTSFWLSPMVVVLCWASFLQENSVRLASNSKPGKNRKITKFFMLKFFLNG
jgi:hypothetical protein